MKRNIFLRLASVILFLCGCTPAIASAPADIFNPTTDTGEQNQAVETIAAEQVLSYSIVDTLQGKCYDNNIEIPCKTSEESFWGQDAQYTGNQPRYQDNGDGTITDMVTGLMWQKDPGQKMTYNQAVAGVSSFILASYSDWRLPSIKELYSLILFDGTDVSDCNGTCAVTPFIDTEYFQFSYGDTDAGERIIDSQFVSSTKYGSTTMDGNETVFGVNFADGRIKGYGISMNGNEKTFYVLHVRGNNTYGLNALQDNGNGTVTDNATGLSWMQSDSGSAMDWESALAYCENLVFAGADDWKLPNIKELQSIVDYNRAPDTTNSAAIDPIFTTSTILNEAGITDYPFYWSSTTHANTIGKGTSAAYIAFGRALGYWGNGWVDVHGAGAQRSDPKSGTAANYPTGHGPQGDAIRIENYARCVRGGNGISTPDGDPEHTGQTMTITSTGIEIQGNTPGQNTPSESQKTPPKEAIAACENQPQDSPCEFSTPDRTINGICQQIQAQMVCIPENELPSTRSTP